jgi:hypothetical protein
MGFELGEGTINSSELSAEGTYELLELLVAIIDLNNFYLGLNKIHPTFACNNLYPLSV